MNVKIINNYSTDENSYLIYNNATGIIIDPGCKTEDILQAASEAGVKIKYILLTHCHYDHIEFSEELRNETGAILMCGDKCAENILNPKINLTAMGLGRILIPQKPEKILNDNESLDVDGMKIKCIYTPGHTDCGVCYLTDTGIFVGDTLFLRSCGRWDLPTGNESTLRKSIKEKLYTLDDELTVYPGHGSKTSIGYEKKFNLYIK